MKEVLEDMIKIMVDYHFSGKKSSVDTGNFKMIWKARPVERPVQAMGISLLCEGKAIKR